LSSEFTFPSLLLSGGGGVGGSVPSGGVGGVPPSVVGAIGGDGATIT